MRLASSANHSMKEAPYAISPRLSARGLPCSSVSSCASGSWCSSMRLYQSSITRWRALPVMAAQPVCAVRAASMAAAVSAALSLGTVPTSAPVAGFTTSNVCPDAAPTHSPFT